MARFGVPKLTLSIFDFAVNSLHICHFDLYIKYKITLKNSLDLCLYLYTRLINEEVSYTCKMLCDVFYRNS